MRVLTRWFRIKAAREARKIRFNYNPKVAAVIKQMRPGDCVRVYNTRLSEATVRAVARWHGTRIKWRSAKKGYIQRPSTCFWLLYPIIPEEEILGGEVGEDTEGLAVAGWNPPAGWEELLPVTTIKGGKRGRGPTKPPIMTSPETLPQGADQILS